MTSPRTIRLLRAPDLQTLHAAVERLACRQADPLGARATAVLVPTRGAAEALRRTLENRTLAASDAVVVLPDILTRADFYDRLHARFRTRRRCCQSSSGKSWSAAPHGWRARAAYLRRSGSAPG